MLVFVLFFAACSHETGYKVLSFIFDGVPDPNFIEANTNDSIAIIDSTKITDTLKNTKPKLFFHPPYQEKSCENCHDGNNGQLLESQPTLCYNCHESFEEKNNYTHGPVAGGYCSDCHDPHKAKNDFLLSRTGQNICFLCHNENDIKEGDIHYDIGETECTECHDPHGGDNKLMIKRGICKKCHGDFSEQYAYLHGPVSGDYCYACHGFHSLETKSHLLKTGQSLCLNCHDKRDVLKNENHDGIEDTNCTECHNPHGGADRYIFN